MNERLQDTGCTLTVCRSSRPRLELTAAPSGWIPACFSLSKDLYRRGSCVFLEQTEIIKPAAKHKPEAEHCSL